MAVSELLGKLKRVKSTGKDRWVACCPAHEDKSPSMTVRQLPDGRVLLHCFAGCDTQAVLKSIGMTFGDLFPDKLTRESLPKVRNGISAYEALECLSREGSIIAICGSDIAEGKPLSKTDADRLCLAVGRVAAALDAVNA